MEILLKSISIITHDHIEETNANDCFSPPELESAMRRDDTAEMQRIMIEIEQKNLSDYLTVEVGDARSRLQGQQGHIQPDPEGHLTRTEASIDARGAARFGQYSQYGTLSHDLLIAALVVIGENERQLGVSGTIFFLFPFGKLNFLLSEGHLRLDI